MSAVSYASFLSSTSPACLSDEETVECDNVHACCSPQEPCSDAPHYCCVSVGCNCTGVKEQCHVVGSDRLCAFDEILEKPGVCDCTIFHPDGSFTRKDGRTDTGPGGDCSVCDVFPDALYCLDCAIARIDFASLSDEVKTEKIELIKELFSTERQPHQF